VEDQITYPISTTMIAAPRVKYVRGESMFGYSFVNVVFEDGTDLYWARSRVLEYMQGITGRLPEGVSPRLGPDATGVGWVYEYALVDRSGTHTLADLRSFQDWYLRYWLESVHGVAEVASVGGFVKLDGEGEAVGGVVVMRHGENALRVIDGVKAKLQEVKKSLPSGVEIVPTYDRSDLINRAIHTLTHTLWEELLIVSLVILV